MDAGQHDIEYHGIILFGGRQMHCNQAIERIIHRETAALEVGANGFGQRLVVFNQEQGCIVHRSPRVFRHRPEPSLDPSPSMTLHCITFDLDDTLWNAGPTLLRAEKSLYDWLGRHYPAITATYSADDLTAHRRTFMRDRPELHHDLTSLRKRWLLHIAVESGYGPELADAAFAVFRETRNQVTLFPDVHATLGTLSRSYRIGAITNGNADVHRIGIGRYFDFVISSERVGAAKPHRAIFLAAINAAGVDGDAMAHVGDDPVRDIAGAAALGMRTVWMRSNGACWPALQAPPDAQITRLSQLVPLLGQCP